MVALLGMGGMAAISPTLAGAQNPGLSNAGVAVPLGLPPTSVAVNAGTHTAYVVASDPNADRLLVVNTATCNAGALAGCGAVTSSVALESGAAPSSVAVNPATDKVYVTDANTNDVSVINGATCNGSTTTGCTQTPLTIPVNNVPFAVAVDSTSNTIYVANLVGLATGTVSVINGSTNTVSATISVGSSPNALLVDHARGTVYVTNSGDDTLSLINQATNIALPATVPVGVTPSALAEDPVSNTLYVANTGSGTVSVLNPATCNATVVASCLGPFPTAAAGASPVALGVNPAAGALYAADQSSNSVSVVNTLTCRVGATAGCSQPPTSVGVGAQPVSLAVDPSSTPTSVYVANQGNATLSVLAPALSPAFTSAPGTVFQQDVRGSFTITATGVPTPVITESGALPNGVTFAAGPAGSATISGASTVAGTFTVTLTATNSVGSVTQSFTLTVTPVAVVHDFYRIVAGNGAVAYFGPGGPIHTPAIANLNRPMVGITEVPGTQAYWLAAADGGVFSYNGAQFYGSTGSIHLNQPVVGMASTADGRGYWLVASDGGIFAFGDARFHGSMGGVPLNKPVVGMAATPDGGGYWLVASDGGIFAFGDAGFHGSMGGVPLNKAVVGMTATPDGGGYWMVASDGGVFSFGDAQFHGSMGGRPLNQPMDGIATAPGVQGYWTVALDGGIFAFNAPFLGSVPGDMTPLGAPVVGITGGVL